MKISKIKLNECFTSMVGITAEISDDQWIDYYVDPLDDDSQLLLHKTLQPNHNIIIGRRGTGKSCLMARAYIECLSSLKQKKDPPINKLNLNKKILPVYLNMKEIWDPTANFGDQAPYVMEIIFMLNFLSKVWISLNSKGVVKLLNWRSRILNKTANIFKSMILKMTKPDFFPISTGKTIISEIQSNTKNFGVELSFSKAELHHSGIKTLTDNKSTKAESIIISTINEIIDELILLLKEYRIDLCYVFLDEFSEIPEDQQWFLERQLISKHFIPQGSVFKAKIAAYPGQYSFKSLSETRELIPIKLDFAELYGDPSKGLNSSYMIAKDKALEFTKSLILKRFEHFELDLGLNELFKKPIDALEYLFLASMNVPRNIGHIMQNCIDKRDMPFSLNDLKGASIEFIEKCESRDYIRKMSQIYTEKVDEHMVSWVKLISKIRKQNENKERSTHVPQSHFWVDSAYSFYLNVLEGSFLVLRIGLITPKDSDRAKHTGLSKKFDVYTLNRAICERENFIYELDSKILARNRFDYSNIFLPYEQICEKGHQINKDEDIFELKNKRYCGICFKDGTQSEVLEKGIDLNSLESREDIDKETLKSVKKYIKQDQDIRGKFKSLKETHNMILNDREKELIEILTYNQKLKNKDIGMKMTEIISHQKVTYLIENLNRRFSEKI